MAPTWPSGEREPPVAHLQEVVDRADETPLAACRLHPSGLDQLMDKTLASALVDRLMHHAHLILTEGESVRLADAVSGKGVMPLA